MKACENCGHSLNSHVNGKCGYLVLDKDYRVRGVPAMLSKEYNYIVSGLERSGTSMMMQILEHGEVPVAYDNSREPDEHNPYGYYELEGGKIISRLMDGSSPLEKYRRQFIKITAYGLKFLPKGNYKVIYMLRNLEEVVRSMEKMSRERIDRKEEKPLLNKLNKHALRILRSRKDIEYIVVSYNHTIARPWEVVEGIDEFLNGALNKKPAIEAVDSSHQL